MTLDRAGLREDADQANTPSSTRSTRPCILAPRSYSTILIKIIAELDEASIERHTSIIVELRETRTYCALCINMVP